MKFCEFLILERKNTKTVGWEGVFSGRLSAKGFLSRMHKELKIPKKMTT